MGVLKRVSTKFTLKPSKKLAAASPDGPKVQPTSAAATAADPFTSLEESHDDDPSLFTTIMLLYFGFFGTMLLAWPQFFSQTWNPMPYWTSISDDMAFIFRIAGTGMLTLVLGPFLDEMFGGPGVVMKAFARQCLIINILIFIIFVYYTFYNPLALAVNFTWQAQTYLQGFVLAWSIIEVSGPYLRSYYNLFVACYYGFFALGLAAAPALLFGPGLSPTVYWNEWTELGDFVARSVGIALLVAIVGGYFLYNGYMTGGSLAKLYATSMLVHLALFVLPAYFGGASAVAHMWELQLAVQVPLVFVGLYVVAAGYAGSTPSVSLLPSCGNNISTFNFINLLWYFPFAVGFFTYPDELFGPGALTGMPMIVVPLDETALWFCKEWGMLMLLIVISPYLFGMPPLKVAQQMTATYVLFVGLFLYALFFTGIFNFPLVCGLTGANFLLLVWGAYLCYKGDTGGYGSLP